MNPESESPVFSSPLYILYKIHFHRAEFVDIMNIFALKSRQNDVVLYKSEHKIFSTKRPSLWEERKSLNWSIEGWSCHVQRSWLDVQRSWLSVQRSWVGVQRSWVNVQRSWLDVQRSGFIWSSWVNVQRSGFIWSSWVCVQRSWLDVQRSGFVWSSWVGVQRSWLGYSRGSETSLNKEG